MSDIPHFQITNALLIILTRIPYISTQIAQFLLGQTAVFQYITNNMHCDQ